MPEHNVPENDVPEKDHLVQVRDTSSKVLAALGLALLFAVISLFWCIGLSNHLSAAEERLAAAEQRNIDLAQKQDVLTSRLKATSETLGKSVGITQQQIDARTQSLMDLEVLAVRAQSARATRLEQAQAEAGRKLGAVQTDVSTVKTDVGGAKASIAETRSDLAATKEQLQRTIGDAGVMSGLIARTHDELEVLKHRGDRTYYEFTLQKGAKPLLLSSIKLQAKKVDDKRSKYTLMVSADDRNIEKKDKSLDEPVQFYTGKDPVLFEIVVNSIGKNVIAGYLSTPKSAGRPAS